MFWHHRLRRGVQKHAEPGAVVHVDFFARRLIDPADKECSHDRERPRPRHLRAVPAPGGGAR